MVILIMGFIFLLVVLGLTVFILALRRARDADEKNIAQD